MSEVMKYEKKDVPGFYDRLDDNFCSNYDGIIDQDVVEQLEKENVCANYPGWNFHGTVWYDKKEELFYCKIMCYGSHVNTISAKTPGELKELVCNTYGHQ